MLMQSPISFAVYSIFSNNVLASFRVLGLLELPTCYGDIISIFRIGNNVQRDIVCSFSLLE